MDQRNQEENRRETAPTEAKPHQAERADAKPRQAEHEDAKPHQAEREERNATLDEGPGAGMSADELQNSILDDSDMNEFQKFCARMSERQWRRAQYVVGALLGVAAGVALFWDAIFPGAETQRQGMFTLPLIIAIAIALIVPNALERQSQRGTPRLRVAMVIALALMLVLYMVIAGLNGGFEA